ncbi:MAG: hypothetical protein KAH22_05635 [Thiotrichaceae bacterium]|nr:hypothetical protein [Thiotrichaceae bacterium]
MNKVLLAGLVFSVSTLVGCGQSPSSNIDLARVSTVAKTTLESMGSGEKKGNADAAIAELREKFEKNLNSATPVIFSEGYVGVTSEKDGSFKGYHDANKNKAKDTGETDLFKIEIDGKNNRVLASNPQDTETESSSFSASGMMMGMMMGMLMGNLMNRQRSSGADPSQKKTTSTKNSSSRSSSSNSSSSRSSSSNSSARSRSGSGSHSRGK